MKYSESPSFMNTEVEMAWQYADAMQAEAEKREKEKQEKLKQDQQNHHDELVSIGLEEWQPDWSQAPEWYNWWAMDADRKCHWFSKKPVLVEEVSEWILWNNGEGLNNTYSPSVNCGYTGNWRDSLRKRPQ